MDESAKVVTPGWLVGIVGAALFAAGLVALCFPVFLDSYDSWGMQIKCGNGYYAQLLQATFDDQGNDQPPAPVGTSAAVRPATNYVDQCKSALAHRRVWVVPVAMLGVLILIPDLVAWARGGSPSSPASTSARSASPTDIATQSAALQSAALLDRRDCSHRARSSNTTL